MVNLEYSVKIDKEIKCNSCFKKADHVFFNGEATLIGRCKEHKFLGKTYSIEMRDMNE